MRELCLVTGGAGFIGSHTVDRLLEAGYPVRVLDSLEPRIHPDRRPPPWLSGDAELIVGDVRERDVVARALRGVASVFHFAAYQDYLPDFSRFIDINVTSTALLYEVIAERSLPVRRVVVASSQAVYGEGAYDCPRDGRVFPAPRTEAALRAGHWDPVCPSCGGAVEAEWSREDEAHPHNQYAASKYAQETVALTLGRLTGVATVALRYSIVQGPRQSFHNAYSGACRVFCVAVHHGRRPPIYEDGHQRRDFVSVHDVIDANLLALTDERAAGRVFNVGGGRSWSVHEFARLAVRESGRDLDPELLGEYRVGDTRHVLSDVQRLQTLGWAPRRTPRDSVREYLAWLDGMRDVIDAREDAFQRMRELNVLRPVVR